MYDNTDKNIAVLNVNGWYYFQEDAETKYLQCCYEFPEEYKDALLDKLTYLVPEVDSLFEDAILSNNAEFQGPYEQENNLSGEAGYVINWYGELADPLVKNEYSFFYSWEVKDNIEMLIRDMLEAMADVLRAFAEEHEGSYEGDLYFSR